MTTAKRTLSVVTVSRSGMVSQPRSVAITLTDGEVDGLRPPAIAQASARPAAAGTIALTVLVVNANADKPADTLEIVQRSYGQKPDFTSPLASRSVGRWMWQETLVLDGGWSEGETVYLAARLLADDVAGDVTLLPPVTVKIAGPTDLPDWIQGVQL